MTQQLHDSPNWLYLLREFDTLYRHGSAGGSKAIRAHRKRVRDSLSSIIESNPPLIARDIQRLPVVDHLDRALDLGAHSSLSRLSRAFRRVTASLTWEHGYAKLSKSLGKRYAYAEVLGPKGPIQSDRLILGFVLFAPNTTYPQHSHRDIEESYISVAGAWSENDNAVHAPGSLVLNRPGDEHRITTGQLDPCLLAYAWSGSQERLTNPGMKFTAPLRRSTAGVS